MQFTECCMRELSNILFRGYLPRMVQQARGYRVHVGAIGSNQTGILF